MAGLRYAPGEAHLVATRGAVVLIDAAIPTELLTRIWREVDEGRGLAAVLEALSGAFGTSLTSIPPFVVAVAEAGGVRLAVRGDILVTVESPAGGENISGTGVTTWSERLVPATRTSIRFGAADPASADLPLRDGVVRASAVVVDWTDAAAAPVAHNAGEPLLPDVVPAESRGATAEAVAPLLRSAPESAEQPAPAPAAGPWSRLAAPAAAEPPAQAEPPALIDSAVVLTAGSVDTWLPQDATLAPEPEADPESTAVDDGPVSATTGYDHLWGATVVRSVEEAAVRAPDEDADAAAGAVSEGGPDDVHADTVASPRRPSDDAAPVDAAHADGTREPGDHDGETISVAQARAMRQGGGAADADSVPPLAPPRAAAPGRIRLSTGQLVLLDRTVVIGRRPRSTRVTGTDLPHLIAVESPDQDISRSHVEVRVEGDSILATDLNTTNGTTLRRVGADPVRLHPGERTVVVPGDVLDLGDGITVTVEDIA